MFIVYFRCGYKIEINVLKLKCRFCKGLFTEVYSMPYWIRLASTCIFNLHLLVCFHGLFYIAYYPYYFYILLAISAFFERAGCCFVSVNYGLLFVYLCSSCVLDLVLVFEVVLLFFSSGFCRFLDGDVSLLLMLKALRCSVVVGLFASE